MHYTYEEIINRSGKIKMINIKRRNLMFGFCALEAGHGRVDAALLTNRVLMIANYPDTALNKEQRLK